MRSGFAVALIAVVALVLGLGSFAQSPRQAELVGEFRWQIEQDDFGGFSGLEISPDGGEFTVVSDGGVVGQGALERAESGEITGIARYESGPLKTTKGVPTDGYTNDAEGLAIRPDGTLVISFEGLHRIMIYTDAEARAVWHKHNDLFDDFQNNSGLEALAMDSDDVLYAVPERSGVLTRPFPVYRFRNDEWDQPFGIPRHPPYLVVGADFGPDGKFYVLERHLSGIFGFQTRVRRFDISGDNIGAEVVLLETPAGLHDNLEGISVWRDGAGDIRITMISDDNFKAFQRTEFVEYRVAE